MTVTNANALTANIITQMALVQGSITTVGNLEEATPVVLQIVYQPVLSAVAAYDAAVAAYDADVDNTSVGGIVLGNPSAGMPAALLNQALDVEQEGRLVVARAYVRRVGANVLNSPG